MKKIISTILVITVVITTTIIAFAVPNNFINSPTAENKAEIVSWSSDDHCDGKLLLKAYSERDELPFENKEDFIEAFHEVQDAPNVADLSYELDQLANKKGIPREDLVIGDFFYLCIITCSNHNVTDVAPTIETSFNNFDDCKPVYLAYNPARGVTFADQDLKVVEERIKNYVIENMAITDKNLIVDHGNLHIEIASNCLQNYVGLLNYSNSDWSLIETAFVNQRGNLELTTKKLGTYAIICRIFHDQPQEEQPLPKTGEDHTLTIILVIACIVSIGLIIFLIATRKKDDKDSDDQTKLENNIDEIQNNN